MSQLALSIEMNTIANRTRRFIGGSVLIHVALLLLMILHRTVYSEPEGLTEITWIEPPKETVLEETAPPVAREDKQAERIQEVVEKPAQQEAPKQRKRELNRSVTASTPQTKAVVTDVLTDRLNKMQNDRARNQTRMASIVQPPAVGAPTLAGVTTEKPRASTPSELKRDDTPKRGPVELKRVPTKPSVQQAAVLPEMPEVRQSPTASVGSSDARRNVAGAQLEGPVADRKLLSMTRPVYPEWAKRDGVEGSVTLRFFVLPDGSVKQNILVERASGFSDFDKNAVAALAEWRFEALPGSGEQWGAITFHFRLTN